MRKLFTNCFFLIATQIFSQDYAIESVQQRVSQAKGSEIIFELNKENRYDPDESQAKYQIESKDKQIRLQKIIIENKDIKLRYSIGAVGILLITLIIIIFLYRKRNKRFKRLVYQNLNIADRKYYKTNKDNVSNYRNTIGEERRQHILDLLEQQISSKIYMEQGLSITILSEKCDTNRTYLSQIIHEKYQMNFNNFINMYRIEEAKRLLMDPDNDVPLKALHERLGFSSYNRFYEAFKKSIGITPSFFLKTIKEL